MAAGAVLLLLLLWLLGSRWIGQPIMVCQQIVRISTKIRLHVR